MIAHYRVPDTALRRLSSPLWRAYRSPSEFAVLDYLKRRHPGYQSVTVWYDRHSHTLNVEVK